MTKGTGECKHAWEKYRDKRKWRQLSLKKIKFHVSNVDCFNDNTQKFPRVSVTILPVYWATLTHTRESCRRINRSANIYSD